MRWSGPHTVGQSGRPGQPDLRTDPTSAAPRLVSNIHFASCSIRMNDGAGKRSDGPGGGELVGRTGGLCPPRPVPPTATIAGANLLERLESRTRPAVAGRGAGR